MKKARIILTMVVILAVVGGAFAYKAKFNGIFVYTISVTNTTLSTTIGTRVYTAAVTQLCTLTNRFFTLFGSQLTTVSTNGATLVATSGPLTTTIDYYTTCILVPNTFTTIIN